MPTYTFTDVLRSHLDAPATLVHSAFSDSWCVILRDAVILNIFKDEHDLVLADRAGRRIVRGNIAAVMRAANSEVARREGSRIDALALARLDFLDTLPPDRAATLDAVLPKINPVKKTDNTPE